jgi:hypothetical protein
MLFFFARAENTCYSETEMVERRLDMDFKSMATNVVNEVKYRGELVALQEINKAYRNRLRLLTDRGTASQKEVNKYLRLISDNLDEQQMLREGKV